MKLTLTPDFYQQPDTLKIARLLPGNFLCTHINGQFTAGMITETEAYEGVGDKAAHSYGGRYTDRTKVMYEAGGVAYVYLCYGLHQMFNVVTHTQGNPHAILIRAIKPVDGIAIMEERRGKKHTQKGFSSGPGTVCQALGITRAQNGLSLQGNTIWIENRGIKVKLSQLTITPRIGIAYAQEDAARLNRFVFNA